MTRGACSLSSKVIMILEFQNYFDMVLESRVSSLIHSLEKIGEFVELGGGSRVVHILYVFATSYYPAETMWIHLNSRSSLLEMFTICLYIYKLFPELTLCIILMFLFFHFQVRHNSLWSIHRVLGYCVFQWCGFHSCTFSKNSPNIQLMRFSLHKWRNSFTCAFLVTNDLSAADLVHADFCQT